MNKYEYEVFSSMIMGIVMIAGLCVTLLIVNFL